MKLISSLLLIITVVGIAAAQNEQSPIVEKDLEYKNWTYNSVLTGQPAELSNLIKGKKLAIVVYYAPWCPNWRHDAPQLQVLYDKYKAAGLEIIGVGEYDPVDSMKNNLDFMKISFPVYYESTDRADKEKTTHYGYRKSTGDTRNWGSPYYVLIEPASIEKKGEILLKHTRVINGEMIMEEGEKLIRQKLGLPAADPKAAVAGKESAEVCDPKVPTTVIKP
jgi:thiol-disulfide isomerase/thioredoxin